MAFLHPIIQQARLSLSYGFTVHRKGEHDFVRQLANKGKCTQTEVYEGLKVICGKRIIGSSTRLTMGIISIFVNPQISVMLST